MGTSTLRANPTAVTGSAPTASCSSGTTDPPCSPASAPSAAVLSLSSSPPTTPSATATTPRLLTLLTRSRDTIACSVSVRAGFFSDCKIFHSYCVGFSRTSPILADPFHLSFELASTLQMILSVVYIISPIDIIPEGILGIVGLLDDLLIVLICFLHVAALYRSVLYLRHGGS
ncbi:uncharacterized protein [Arachis hypogaea]|uniref:uncharacterized protein isoform X2 n=1 Tax=Arachis hypogaea TaxID=3818 RepID=UPI003B21D9DA